jgi:signal transduction histidine kinase
VPRRPSTFGALSRPGIPLAVLSVALVVSALASWWLARHFSAPIRRLQEGARAVASESLDLRVSAGLDGRNDELAVLARDFDAMADQLKANRIARTRLLRDISHELRSPLARMRLAVGLARQLPADPGRQLDRLESEIERLDTLISQVLQLARLQSTDAHYEKESVPIDEVIEEVVRDAEFEGAAKGCRITLSGRTGACVHGNRELLRSAIENVLRNAVRYSPPSAPVEVEVSAANGTLGILVRDRGPGVPGEDLARIFEPFFRVAESRDRGSGGEGIGLAITAQVLKSHGGTAVAVNRPQGGLEVQLSMPLEPGRA